MGIWSCLGTDIETVKDSLYNGKSGIVLDNDRLKYGYRSGLVGLVERPVLTKKDLDRHIRAGMSEEAEYAYMAARQAFAMSGIDKAYLQENEVGCIFGNDSSAKPVVESAKINIYFTLSPFLQPESSAILLPIGRGGINAEALKDTATAAKANAFLTKVQETFMPSLMMGDEALGNE